MTVIEQAFPDKKPKEYPFSNPQANAQKTPVTPGFNLFTSVLHNDDIKLNAAKIQPTIPRLPYIPT